MKTHRSLSLLGCALALLLSTPLACAHTTTTSEWDPATHQMVQVSHWSLFRHPLIGTTTSSSWDPATHQMVDTTSHHLNPPIHIRPAGKHWWNHIVTQDTH